MFARIQGHRHPPWYLQAKDMLGVPPHARGVAVLPLRVNGVNILQPPVAQPAAGGAGVNACLLPHLARGRGGEGFIRPVLAAGDGLPEILGRIGAVDPLIVGRPGLASATDDTLAIGAGLNG